MQSLSSPTNRPRRGFCQPVTLLLAALLLGTAPAAFAQSGVGIGTTAPDVSAALDIVSSSKGALLHRVADAATIATPATGLLVFQTNAPAGFYYNAGTPAAPSWQQLATAAGAAVLAGNGLTKTGSTIGLGGTLSGATAIDNAGFDLTVAGAGNLGLGTTAPLSRLSISPGAVEPKITLFDGGSTINHYGFGISGNQLNYHVLGTTDRHVFYAGGKNGDGTELLRIQGNGNVGIGGIVPSQKLHVAGTVYSSTGGFKFPDGSVQTTAATTAPTVTASNGLTKTGNNIALGGTLTQATTLATGGFNLNLTGTGNVGIGLSGPQATLELARGTGAFGTLGIRGTTRETHFNFGTAEDTYLRGGKATSNVLLNDNGGSVGIGTATPDASAALDVSSTGQGLLPPRLSQTQRDGIAGPAAGLTLYNTTTNKVNVWNGTSWDAPLTANEQAFQNPAATFFFTGATQTYTVPAGVTRLRVDARAAGGGTGFTVGNNVGGAGARMQATLSVSPGQMLQVQVGGAGAYGASTTNITNGGYNGGGAAYAGGAGGGATDVRSSGGTLADRLLVAAGGGGGGYNGPGSQGGGGGAPTGGDGTNGTVGSGTGATQAAGGNRQGTLSTGGNGSVTTGGGGGGGGYYGGSSGSGGGGGGSSWVTPAGSAAITLTAGANPGDGSLTLTPELVFAAPVLDASNFVNIPGDNLGNHTATQNLNLGTNQLVGNGGSTGLTVSTGGSVGIGAATPLTRLSITPSAVEAKITLYDGGSATDHYGFGVSSAQLNYHVPGTTSRHVFYAGGKNGTGTELLRIQGNGFVGIGTGSAAPRGYFDVAGAGDSYLVTNPNSGNGQSLYLPGHLWLALYTGTSGIAYIQARVPNPTVATNLGLTLRTLNSGALVDALIINPSGSANFAGNVTAPGFFNTSDARLKENIRPLTGALAAVQGLRGVRYRYRHNLPGKTLP